MKTMPMKTIIGTTSAPGRHWVGDGFPVHGMFGYSGPDVPTRSPFLLLDYAAPTHFEPTTHRRGVGQPAVAGVVGKFDGVRRRTDAGVDDRNCHREAPVFQKSLRSSSRLAPG